MWKARPVDILISLGTGLQDKKGKVTSSSPSALLFLAPFWSLSLNVTARNSCFL